MKIFIIFVMLGICSCGSKKEFARSDTLENFRASEQLNAELYRTTRLLELLDIKIRQVETRDSSGNVRIETNTDISKHTEGHELDTTILTENKQEEGEKTTNLSTREERSGVMGSWVWIVGFVALIVVALVVGVGIFYYGKNRQIHL